MTPSPTQADAYIVSGSGFALGLTAEIFQNGALLETISGSAITNVAPTSFTLESLPLSPGAYSLQVVNADQGLSAPFSFTVP